MWFVAEELFGLWIFLKIYDHFEKFNPKKKLQYLTLQMYIKGNISFRLQFFGIQSLDKIYN